MFLFGDKKTFALGLEIIDGGYSVYLYTSGNNILEYLYEGEKYTFTWHTLQYFMEWLQTNLKYILDEKDVCELFDEQRPAATQAELYQRDKMSLKEVERFLDAWQPWYFRHSWFDYRDGTYLADICFRTMNYKVEISWRNEKLFQDEGVRYTHPKGVAYVDATFFRQTVEDFLRLLEQERCYISRAE